MFEKIASKLDINWHGAWRKIVVGAWLAAGMGYLYKQNKLYDEHIDEVYPGPRAAKKAQQDSEETS